MRKRNILLLLVVMLVLVACGGRSSGAPTLVPTVVLRLEDMPPHLTPTPNLPPTYTPEPAAAPPTALPLPGTPETYVVQSGDTLAGIAAQFGVTVEALAEANNIENVDLIDVGQTLIIPR